MPRKEELIRTISNGAAEVVSELGDWIRDAVEGLKTGAASPYTPIVKRAVSASMQHLGANK